MKDWRLALVDPEDMTEDEKLTAILYELRAIRTILEGTIHVEVEE